MAKQYHDGEISSNGFRNYLFCTINFIFFVFGCTVGILGFWIYFDDKSLYEFLSTDLELESLDFNEFVKSYIYEGSLLIAVIGIIILIVSFLGCCSVLIRSIFMVTVYSTLLVLILILEISLTSLAVSYKDKIGTGIRHIANEPILINYSNDNDNNSAFVQAFNRIMIDNNCCAINNVSDFYNYPEKLFLAPEHCQKAFQNNTDVIGCYDVFAHWITQRMDIVFVIVLMSVLVQIFCILVSCCIACRG